MVTNVLLAGCRDLGTVVTAPGDAGMCCRAFLSPRSLDCARAAPGVERPAELPGSHRAGGCATATETLLSLFRYCGRRHGDRPAQKSQQASRRCSNGTLRMPNSRVEGRPHRSRQSVCCPVQRATSMCMHPDAIPRPPRVRVADRESAAVAERNSPYSRPVPARKCSDAGGSIAMSGKCFN